MEIDSGDEAMPQQQQQQPNVTVSKQQQLSQEQLNTMAQALQVFPNLFPAIQQQQHQQLSQQPQQQQISQQTQQQQLPQQSQQQQLPQQTQQLQQTQLQQNSYLIPNQTSNYLTLLPTPVASATVRPGFPMNMAQPRNLPPLLPPSLPALPLVQPALPSLNISQHLPTHVSAIQSSQYQQQLGLPSVNQPLNTLPGNIINNQLNPVIQNSAVLTNQPHQPQIPYRNNQQVLGAMNSGPRQSFTQQQVGAVSVPITTSLQPLPMISATTTVVTSSWHGPSYSAVTTFTTSSTDNTPLFLKAARANAAVNIAPPVTHPSAIESIPTRPPQTLPMPQLPLVPLPSSVANAKITPLPVATSAPMSIVQSSSVPVPITTTQTIQAKPLTVTAVAETIPLSFAVATVSTSVPTTTTAVSSSTSSQNALALASSLVPGLDTEVLQSILRTVKIGSSNKSTSSEDTTQVSINESNEVASNTPSTFEADDMQTGDPNVVLFGERKRKPSNDKETSSQVDDFEPNPKSAKVDVPTTKASIPPWLQGGGGPAINGPVSSGGSNSSGSNDEPSLLLVGKDRPPLRPYFRDLESDHGPPMKSKQSTFEDEEEAPYTFEDHDYEPFDPKISFVKDYGHGQRVSSMDYNHGQQIRSQELKQESDQQPFDDQDSGSESPDTDQGLFIKDQELDQESPIKAKKFGQGLSIQVSMEDNVVDHKTDQVSTSVPIANIQRPTVVYQKPPVLYTRPSHGPPVADEGSNHGPPITDQKPSGPHTIDERPSHESNQKPSHGPVTDQKPSHGPSMMSQRPTEGLNTINQRLTHGHPMPDQRHACGPPVIDQIPTHDPPMENQRPNHAPVMENQIPSHGLLVADEIHTHGPPMADLRPGHGSSITDQRPSHGGPPSTDQRADHGPTVRDQVFNITDQRRGQEPFISDQRHNQGFPIRDQGPINNDHATPFRRQEGGDFRFPIRSQGPRDQWLPGRHQGFPLRGQEPPIRYVRDHGPSQGHPGRDQHSYFTRDPIGNQGPVSDQRPDQGILVSDQGSQLQHSNQGPTANNKRLQESDKETTKDQEPSSGGEHKPNKDTEHELSNRDQESGQDPHVRDQEFSGNNQGPYRDHGPLRNSPEPNSEQYQFSQVPPPDHFDRPFPDKYYRGNDRPPWRPPMGPRRMSSPPFYHHPPPRNIRFPPPPPPRDSQWPHQQEYSPRHPPPQHRGPPRLPPYRQPYY